jgi:murein DD-endopeptidase MepM/ murein hydrolase activator NlpD
MYDQGDGGNIYWKADGESLKKAFLKAPLKFTRISSGFSYRRRHPVTGKVRPHTAVDYAAPSGTPVMTIGDGTVLSAGWTNGGGKTVKIRHNASYTTSYMHLSRFATGIKEGARVHQGQVIGYVGSTGMSTGPHLDFRVWKNGTPINPLTLESPAATPILPENLPALDSTHRVYRQIIDSLTTRQ